MTESEPVPFPQVADRAPMFRLMQLASAASPVGSFAYSDGLETAVSHGTVHDEYSAHEWIAGLLSHTVCQLDLPVLAALHRAMWDARYDEAKLLSQTLLAFRETAELRNRERWQGRALMRLVNDLHPEHQLPPLVESEISYVYAFASACVLSNIETDHAVTAYAFAWCESAVTATVKLVPLGQTAGQRILHSVSALDLGQYRRDAGIDLESLMPSAPAQAIYCALHETQEPRLFRS